MKLKENRTISFVILALIYVLASAIGILLYQKLPYTFWVNLLIADVVATIITFLFSVILANASVYDPYWSVAPLVVFGAYAWGKELTSLQILLLIAIFFWGIRLTANWAYTFHGLNHQDWRYTMLQDTTGPFYPIINFVGIHMVPTLIVYGCMLPAAYSFQTEVSINRLSFLCFLVSIGAVTMQATADVQMHTFRKNRTSTFIRVGLWKNSRHPNYLGEILMWWGIAGAVIIANPSLWYLCAGAAANTLLFLFVSIPLADNRQAKKEGFDTYKAETRMLLPIKKKGASHHADAESAVEC